MTSRLARLDPAVLKRLYPLETVVAAAGVALRRSGARLIGRCPFHADDTPSFTVYPAQGTYHCFGCGAHGDVFRFLMTRHGCGFSEAVARLTGDPFPAAPPPIQSAPRAPALTGHQQAILTAVAAAYAEDLTAARALDAALATAPVLSPARRVELRREHRSRRADLGLTYLRARGVSDGILTPAGVGWCAGDRLAGLARQHGWAEGDLITLGLLDGRGQERLAGRVTVPERRAGRCVWLVGRSISQDRPGHPKYLGIRVPRQALGLEVAARRSHVVIVEGIIDYLVGLTWGLPALALGGLGLRPDDLAALRHVRVITLLLDADRAGQAEAQRLAALIGRRAQVLHPPLPAKDLADLVHQPTGRAWLAALRDDVGRP